jgi:hypothetical protein
MGMFDAPGPAENQPDKEEDKRETEGYDTDVEGVKSQDIMKHGHNEFPVFDCTENEFYQNMQNGRKRLRFKSGSAASQYMSGTKYKRPFYIRTTTPKGTFTRKIK